MFEILRSRNFSFLFGFFLFVGMMSVGYYYNLTFVQIGLEDLGTRLLGLNATAVARDMALLALLTCVIALAFGRWMTRQGWGRQFRRKLQLSFGVIVLQSALTFISAWVTSEAAFLFWLAGVSLALGVGVPVMFSLTTDLVPVRWRGWAAALVTALAYFAAAAFSDEWRFETFRQISLLLLLAGLPAIGLLAFLRHPWLNALAAQHLRPEFAIGRFTRGGVSRKQFFGFIIAMFGIYFVDSLGFLRLLKTPLYMESAWQSPDFDIRLFIAITHVIGAMAAGALYTSLRLRPLFLWVFGIFALTHLQYSFHIRVEAESGVLSMPMLYALAVSIYTVLNFAIWADLSTPDTIPFNAALGVALSGWTATFLSTGLAIAWGEQLSLERHIQVVDSLAMLFFLALLIFAFLPTRKTETA
jgi:MFS family permease